MPTLEFSDGRVIRDGAAIIDHFEKETGCTFSPTTPRQRFFSRLFDVIGAEGFLRPGMHYRWNFDAENLEFLNFHTMKLMPPGDIGVEMTRKAHERMRKATAKFGVNAQTRDLVEQLYADQLGALDSHFAAHPYLLQRVQDEYAALDADDRQAVDAMLQSSNMAPLMEAKLTRKIGRKDNLEVWL